MKSLRLNYDYYFYIYTLFTFKTDYILSQYFLFAVFIYKIIVLNYIKVTINIHDIHLNTVVTKLMYKVQRWFLFPFLFLLLTIAVLTLKYYKLENRIAFYLHKYSFNSGRKKGSKKSIKM